MKKQNFELKTSDLEILRISGYGLENIQNSTCIIYVHGFKGFKDWGFVPYLAEFFSNKGFFVLTFNFSHNGIGKNLFEFTELEKFAANTFSREVNELSELINAYKNNFFGRRNNNKIGVLGHSRGGAISLLTANIKSEIAAVAVWASVSKLDRYSERQKAVWRKTGIFKVLNQRTGQEMKLNVTLLEDIENNSDGILNIQKAVSELNRPLFIAHGEEDLAVPIQEGEQLYKWSNKNLSEFYRIKSAGHTFNIKHPFEGSNEKFESLLSKTYDFFKQNLI